MATVNHNSETGKLLPLILERYGDPAVVAAPAPSP